MSRIEIQNGRINGTMTGGTDYQGPSFKTGKFFAPDPRLWVKPVSMEELGRTNSCKSILAFRTENDGFLFLIYTQKPSIGPRDGDGAFAYVCIPYGANVKGQSVIEFIDFLRKRLETTGFIEYSKDETINKWCTHEFEDTIKHPKVEVGPTSSNVNELKYAYIDLEKRGRTIGQLWDIRFQKIFGKYAWIILSKTDARQDFSVKNVDDISTSLQDYHYWEEKPATPENKWTPKLYADDEYVPSGSWIYDDKKYKIEWKYSDSTLKYDGMHSPTYQALVSGDFRKVNFVQSRIKELFDFSVKVKGEGTAENIPELLEYKFGGGCLPVEKVEGGKYGVFLSQDKKEERKVNHIHLKKGAEKNWDLSTEGETLVLTRKKRLYNHQIYDGKDLLCEISAEKEAMVNCQGLVRMECKGNNPYSGDLEVIKYGLRKKKIAMPLFVIGIVTALLVGGALGYFGNEFVKGRQELTVSEDTQSENATDDGASELDKNPASLLDTAYQRDSMNTGETTSESARKLEKNVNVNGTQESDSKTCVVHVKSNDQELGTVTQKKFEVKKGETIIVKANPKFGCEFDYWDVNGNTEANPLNYRVEKKDVTITAYFKGKE